MNKLKEEINQTLIDNRFQTVDNQVNALAEVSKRWIEEAMDDAYHVGVVAGVKAEREGNYNNIGSHSMIQRWIEEKGENGLNTFPS